MATAANAAVGLLLALSIVTELTGRRKNRSDACQNCIERLSR